MSLYFVKQPVFYSSSGEDHQAKVETLVETNTAPVVCGFCEVF